MELRQNNCCALVIDYQERLVPAMDRKEELIENSVKLLKGLSLLEIPMVVTEQYPKGLGATVSEIKEACGDAPVYAKTAFSALGCDGAKAKLEEYKAQGREYVLVCGIEGHVCVLQSALDLAAQGFKPVFVTDCITSRRCSDFMAAIVRAEREGVQFVTTEMVLFELIGGKEHPHFKAISALVK